MQDVPPKDRPSTTAHSTGRAALKARYSPTIRGGHQTAAWMQQNMRGCLEFGKGKITAATRLRREGTNTDIECSAPVGSWRCWCMPGRWTRERRNNGNFRVIILYFVTSPTSLSTSRSWKTSLPASAPAISRSRSVTDHHGGSSGHVHGAAGSQW